MECEALVRAGYIRKAQSQTGTTAVIEIWLRVHPQGVGWIEMRKKGTPKSAEPIIVNSFDEAVPHLRDIWESLLEASRAYK